MSILRHAADTGGSSCAIEGPVALRPADALDLDVDAELACALKQGAPGAAAALFDRFAGTVERVVMHVLGPDAELDDVVQEVFVRAFGSIHSLRDDARLSGWIVSTAVFTARGVIRARKRRRLLQFGAERAPAQRRAVEHLPEEAREAVARTYAVLDCLSPDLRASFTLRYIAGMELGDVAAACDVSLATIKRRLQRAEQRFARLAHKDAVLRPWLEEGGRWTR